MLYTRRTNPTTFYTPQGEIACEPFPANSLTIKQEKGIVIPTNKNVLTALKVLFADDSQFKAGDRALFEAEQCTAIWAKKVYTTEDGQRFILAPVNQVKVLERPLEEKTADE